MLRDEDSKNNALNNVPVDDLAEVMRVASEMQEATRLQYSEKQSDEQIRLATIELAKDLGIEQKYLAQAAKAVHFSRQDKTKMADEARIEWCLKDKAEIKRRDAKERNMRFGVLLAASFALVWLLSLFLAYWIAIALIVLAWLIFFLKWLYIDP